MGIWHVWNGARMMTGEVIRCVQYTLGHGFMGVLDYGFMGELHYGAKVKVQYKWCGAL